MTTNQDDPWGYRERYAAQIAAIKDALPTNIPASARDRIAFRKCTLWVDSPGESLTDFMAHLVKYDPKDNPNDWKTVPSLADIFAAKEKALGRPIMGQEKVELARQIEGMTEDEKLEACPTGGSPEKAASVASAEKKDENAVKRFAQMTEREREDEIERRWGRAPGTLLPSERKRFMEALEKADGAPAIHSNDAAAIEIARQRAAAGKRLTPQEAMNAFRAAEAVKKAAGSR